MATHTPPKHHDLTRLSDEVMLTLFKKRAQEGDAEAAIAYTKVTGENPCRVLYEELRGAPFDFQQFIETLTNHLDHLKDNAIPSIELNIAQQYIKGLVSIRDLLVSLKPSGHMNSKQFMIFLKDTLELFRRNERILVRLGKWNSEHHIPTFWCILDNVDAQKLCTFYYGDVHGNPRLKLNWEHLLEQCELIPTDLDNTTLTIIHSIERNSVDNIDLVNLRDYLQALSNLALELIETLE